MQSHPVSTLSLPAKLLFTGILIVLTTASTLLLEAARPAYKMGPKECQSAGIDVNIQHTKGALHHRVTVTIAEDSIALDDNFSARVSGPGIQVPVLLREDDQGNRSLQFSMSREQLEKAKVWLDSEQWKEWGAFIDLPSFLESVEVK